MLMHTIQVLDDIPHDARLGACVLVVYFEGHRAEPLTGLLQRAPTGRPTRTPPL